jgi:hypothetical protein
MAKNEADMRAFLNLVFERLNADTASDGLEAEQIRTRWMRASGIRAYASAVIEFCLAAAALGESKATVGSVDQALRATVNRKATAAVKAFSSLPKEADIRRFAPPMVVINLTNQTDPAHPQYRACLDIVAPCRELAPRLQSLLDERRPEGPGLHSTRPQPTTSPPPSALQPASAMS